MKITDEEFENFKKTFIMYDKVLENENGKCKDVMEYHGLGNPFQIFRLDTFIMF